MAKRFAEEVVWITGGGSGIGRALAMELSRRGAKVAVSGRRQHRLEEVVAQIQAQGGEALAVSCDVTKEQALRDAVQAVVQRWGRLDVAVANAGFSVMGKIEQLTADEWRRQLEVNVVACAQTARFAIPELAKTKGQIVLVSSVTGFLTGPKAGAYAASKYAVRAIGQTLELELRGRGITCTTLYPGFVESEIAQVNNAGQYDPNAPDKRPKRYMLTAEDAARRMANAIARRAAHYAFPGYGKVGAWVGMHAPGLLKVAARWA